MTWTLRTARSAYVVGDGLVLQHWGDPKHPRAIRPVPHASFETDADVAPLEFAAGGTRHAQTSELLVVTAGGTPSVSTAQLHAGRTGGQPEYNPVRGLPAGTPSENLHPPIPQTNLQRQPLVPGGLALSVESVEPVDDGLRARLAGDGVEVTLHWRTSPDHDVVERWAVVRALRDVTLTRAFGAGWNVPVGPGARVGELVGAWSREFTPAEVDLPAGQLSLGSRQGVTSHTYAPVVTLRSRNGTGEAFGIALAWSGSWRMQVDAVPFRDVVRVSAGIDDESTVIALTAGEEFATPHLLGVWSPDGPAGLARAWHEYQRAALVRPGDRPIVYNSWYATTFDVRVEHQLALADVAAEIGAEVFVVDDGWFRGRTSDRAGLGDWFADEDKFPDGLAPLVKGVLERGMRFGLWVEPEAVSPDSDLFRQHPDWVHGPLITMRNQYTLDLGRPEVEEWAAAMLRRLLVEHPISYLKWDMNRAITRWAPGHTEAYYRLMRMLRAEFPHVTVEACAGGGGRIDNAVLALSDVVWPSDGTGPRDRLAIQHGFLSAYPPSVMSSWVTDEPDQLDTAGASLEFRFVVAMAGVLGVGADLLGWSTATRSRAGSLIALYREIRPVVLHGVVTRHGQPGDTVYAVQYTTDARVVLLVWARPGARPVQVPLAGLDPGGTYRVHGAVVNGGALVVGGVHVPFALAPDCDVVVLDRL